MRRKLVNQGGSSYTVAMPKAWIKTNNLEAGTEVDVEEAENNIIISTKSINKKKEATVKSPDKEVLLRVNLWHLYREGYDKITIEGTKHRDMIAKVTNNHLLGFEITEENPITLENVAEPSEEKQDILFRRIFLITKQMFQLIEDDMKKGKYNNKLIDEHLNKILQYELFCRRNIAKKKFTGKSTNSYWSFYDHLSMIGGRLRKLYMYYSNKKTPISKSTIATIKKMNGNFNNLYEGTFKKDIELIQKCNETARNITSKDLEPSLEKSKGTESMIIHFFTTNKQRDLSLCRHNVNHTYGLELLLINFRFL